MGVPPPPPGTNPDSHTSQSQVDAIYVACSRLRDGGGKSFSNKKCEKRAGAATAPFPKSCASYFRFARFNTLVPTILSPFPSRAPLIFALLVLIRWFPLYYLRAWHRLLFMVFRIVLRTLEPGWK